MDKIIAAKSAGLNQAPDPFDVFFDFLIEENGAIGTTYAHHTESDMDLALVQPWCSIGSDGSALAIEGPLRAVIPTRAASGRFPASWVNTFGIASCYGSKTPCGK